MDELRTALTIQTIISFIFWLYIIIYIKLNISRINNNNNGKNENIDIYKGSLKYLGEIFIEVGETLRGVTKATKKLTDHLTNTGSKESKWIEAIKQNTSCLYDLSINLKDGNKNIVDLLERQKNEHSKVVEELQKGGIQAMAKVAETIKEAAIKEVREEMEKGFNQISTKLDETLENGIRNTK
ncbi:MAG: hypothetical protein ACFFDH_00130 [Promethearchaeota archaeon]